MAETHEKDRHQKQTKQTKQLGSRSGLKTASQENKDSPSQVRYAGTFTILKRTLGKGMQPGSLRPLPGDDSPLHLQRKCHAHAIKN